VSAASPSTVTGPPAVDVVVPVYGGLHHVRGCLGSVTATLRSADHLVVVDDGSEPATAAALRDLTARSLGRHRTTLLTNDANLGFLRTANRGMQAGGHDWVVVLNSDTLVTPGWLDGLHAALTSAPDVGLTSPVSNHANLTRIAVPAGTDVLDLAATVRRVSPRSYPEIGIGSGFCLASRRALLEELGYFDEVFGRGYFEESDLSLRAAAAGWRTVADDTTYVHHHGWASFGPAERTRLMAHNAEVFAARWGDAHDRWQRRVRRARPFGELERRVHAALVGHAQPHPRRPLPRSGARWVAEKARQGRGVAEKARQGRADATRRAGAVTPPPDPLAAGQPTPTHRRRPMGDWRRLAADAVARQRGVSAATSVLVLAPSLTCDPIATSLLALVDRLDRRGIRANLATSGPYDPALLTDPSAVRPFVLSGPDEALDVVPRFDVVVATDPATVYDALLLAGRHGSRVAARFEVAVAAPLAWPDDGLARAVAASLVPTHLGPYGEDLVPDWRPVPLGIDTDLFRPAEAAPAGAPVLVLHDVRAGPHATAIAATVVTGLQHRSLDVAVYGDGPPGAEVAATPLSPATVEVALLRGAAAVVEVGPFPGADRLRLRAAACRAPLVTAAPLGPTSRLQALEHVWAAPVDDVPSLLRTVERVVRGDDPTRQARLVAAAAVAAAHTLDDEADAFARALDLRPEPGRPVLDPAAARSADADRSPEPETS
jgi:GT2 family glycosyltransferase